LNFILLQTHNALSSQLKAAGVKILSTFSVTENPEVAFSDIKAWDAKIIIGNFGPDMAQRIICMVSFNFYRLTCVCKCVSTHICLSGFI